MARRLDFATKCSAGSFFKVGSRDGPGHSSSIANSGSGSIFLFLPSAGAFVSILLIQRRLRKARIELRCAHWNRGNKGAVSNGAHDKNRVYNTGGLCIAARGARDLERRRPRSSSRKRRPSISEPRRCSPKHNAEAAWDMAGARCCYRIVTARWLFCARVLRCANWARFTALHYPTLMDSGSFL